MINPGKIYSLIPKISKDLGAVGKDGKNASQGYKFRGIEDLYNAAHPAFVKHGVFCCPSVLEYETSDRVRKSGSIALRVIMRISHKFYAEDGSFIEVTTVGEAIDDADKASNKCMSAAMKYALIELFCVPTEDLDDGDKNSPEAGSGGNGKHTTEPRTFGKPKSPDLEKFNAEHPPIEIPKTEAGEFIERGRQAHFAKAFRESLPQGSQKNAEKIRHGWLNKNGYLDKDGNPSSAMIALKDFAEVLDRACKFANEYQEVPF